MKRLLPTTAPTERTLQKPSLDNAASGIVAMDAVSLMEAVHKRTLSCVEIMQAFLGRIDECNQQHNALVALEDPESMLKQAQEKDQQLQRGEACGLMHGFPQAPKDLMPVKGMLTTRGSLVYRSNISSIDAVAFARMREAGAVFIGRSNTPELGLGGHTYNQVYGITRNAHDTALSAGGSSGGAAVAVACCMLPVADGSDTMGSLRTPAAFNGVFGLRTTPELIPHGMPDTSVWPPLAVCGPMARTVPDLALLLAVQADFPDSLPFVRSTQASAFVKPLQRDLSGVKVAWLGDLGGYLPLDSGMLQACEAAMPLFREIGCDVYAAVPTFNYEALWESWITLRSFLFQRANSAILREPTQWVLTKPEAQWELQRGMHINDAQVKCALQVREAWRSSLNVMFSDYDFILLPAVQVFPFDAEQDWPKVVGGQHMDTYHRWMQVATLAPMGGVPALSVPVSGHSRAHTTGLQILARPHAELSLLQLGYAYDLARHFSMSPHVG